MPTTTIGGRSGKSLEVVSGPGTGGTVVNTGPGGVGSVVLTTWAFTIIKKINWTSKKKPQT